MAELLHIYMNNPTEGSKDGTEVSSGTELAPISVLLDAGKGEQKAVKCAVRCESGFHIDGVLTIKFVGDHADKWKAATDNNTLPRPHWSPPSGKTVSHYPMSAIRIPSSGSRHSVVQMSRRSRM